MNGILFNHESPRRGETFVTRKITRTATRIKLGLQEKLYLGNLEAKRDWGYAKDYVEGMWRMLQHSEPDDFVLATGKTQTVQDFADLVFKQLELDPKQYIEMDPRYFRPAEVDLLLGDCRKATEKLGWTASTSLAPTRQTHGRSRLRTRPPGKAPWRAEWRKPSGTKTRRGAGSRRRSREASSE